MKRKTEINQVSEPLEQYEKPLSFESVWQLFQETDRILTEKFRETDMKFQETDKMFKETDKKFQESERRMKKLEGMFTSQWGKLMESLVEGDLLRLLKERGIPVKNTAERNKGNYEGISYEFDIIAENGQDVVFVEVKTTLKPDDVREFIEKLKRVKTWLPKYTPYKVYGAMAYLRAETGSDKMAQNQRLFVIRATGSSASIINPPDFKPKAF
jgi:hypothetical protein